MVEPTSITNVAMVKQLRELWPNASISLGDVEYLWPTVAELKHELKRTTIDRWPWKMPWDCDKFGGLLAGWFIQLIPMDTLPRAWPLARARGYFATAQGAHECNLCWCREGIRLVEPQTDMVWTPGRADHLDKLWL